MSTTDDDLFAELSAAVEAADVAPTEAQALPGMAAAPPPKKKRDRRKLDAPTTTPAQRSEAVRELAAAVNAPPLPEDRIGCVVWWSAHDIRVRAHVLLAALQAVDDSRPLDNDGNAVGPIFADLVPAPVGVAVAARRAISTRQRGLPDGLRWYDVGTDGNGAVVIALGEESANAAGRAWEATTKWTVVFHLDGRVETPDLAAIGVDDAAAIRALIARYETVRANLTATDVGAILVRVFVDRLLGARVKAGGGVYFVPKDNDVVVDMLAAAFARAGVSLRRLPAGRDMSETFAGDMNGSLADEIQQLADDAQRALDDAKRTADETNNRKRPRMASQTKRLADLEGVRARARAYRVLLGSLVSDVDGVVAAAEAATQETVALLKVGES